MIFAGFNQLFRFGSSLALSSEGSRLLSVASTSARICLDFSKVSAVVICWWIVSASSSTLPVAVFRVVTYVFSPSSVVPEVVGCFCRIAKQTTDHAGYPARDVGIIACHILEKLSLVISTVKIKRWVWRGAYHEA